MRLFDLSQMPRHALLRQIITVKVHHRCLLNRIRLKLPLENHLNQAFLHLFRSHIQELHRGFQQPILGHVSAAALGKTFQHIGHATLQPEFAVFLKPQLHGNLIGLPKADAVNILHQAVRIVLHHFQGFAAVQLIDANRLGHGDSQFSQGKRNFRKFNGLAKGFRNHLQGFRSDSPNFQQLLRILFQHVQGGFPEAVHNQVGHLRADALHVSRRQKGSNPIRVVRNHLFVGFRVELLAVFAVHFKFPNDAVLHAGIRIMKTSGHRKLFVFRFKDAHRVSIFFIMKNYPLQFPDFFHGSPLLLCLFFSRPKISVGTVSDYPGSIPVRRILPALPWISSPPYRTSLHPQCPGSGAFPLPEKEAFSGCRIPARSGG